MKSKVAIDDPTSVPTAGAAGGAPRRPDIQAIAGLSMGELSARMEPTRLRESLDLLDWLASPEQRQNIAPMVGELCERFVQAGVPLDRYASSSTMITADYDAIGRV